MSTPSHPGPRCAEIFDLARDHGLPCERDDASLGDRAEAFLDDYRAWVPARDAEVEKYLQATRSRYRVFLPNRPAAPVTAGAMYWYFDDLVLSDPLTPVAASIPLIERYEFQPAALVTQQVTAPGRGLWAPVVNDQLRKLLTVRDAMLAEAIIMTTPPALEWGRLAERTDLLEDAELRAALTQSYVCSSRLEVVLGSVRDANGCPLPEAATWVFRRIDNGFGGILIFHEVSPKVPGFGSVTMSVPIEQEKFHAHPKGVIPPGFEGGIRKSILHDLTTHAQLVSEAQHHHGAVLSERDVDLTMMRKLLGDTNGLLEAEQRGRWSFELALPHLQGLTPMQLFELRHELPEAFAAFRAELVSYCVDSRNVEHAHSKAEALTKLEIELEASLRAKLRSNRIVGWGSGTVAAASIVVGGLGMSFLGPALPLGGMIAAAARSTQAKREVHGNPACFIWNAKRKAQSSSS